MATLTYTYATPATLTWGMTNPSSDSTLLIGRESTAVDQGSNNYIDVIIGGHFAGPSSGAAAGRIQVFAYGSWDDGTTWTGINTGTDGALTLTATDKERLFLVESITTTTTNSDVYKWGPISLARVFGGVMPERWGLWGVHSAGGALTTSTTKYTGVTLNST